MILLIYGKPCRVLMRIDAMNEEIKSMHENDVWDLV